MDYKQDAVEQIMLNCTTFLSDSQLEKLKYALYTSLHKYDVYIKDEQKELPATVNEYNLNILKKFMVSKSIVGISKSTLSLYHYQITTFFDNIDKKAIEVTADDIKYYLAIKKVNNNLSNTTLENIRLSLSSFYKWMLEEEYISKNPVLKVPRIKLDTVKEEPFSQQEIELLAIAIDNNRDRAIMEFLLSTGCRVSEMCSVNKDQIDYTTKQLIVIGKGNKERTVFVSDKALVYIKKYLDERTDNNEALFVTKKKPNNRLTKDSVESILRDLGKKAGVLNVHPHRFRRTLCNTLINRGMPLQDAQKVMGHSDPNTTLIYYNNNSDNIQNKFKNLI